MALAAGQTGHLTDHQEGVYQVDHGATAGTARPTLGSSSTAPNVVLWNGSVEPTNAQNGDWWFDSANSLVKVKEGGSFVASGSGTYATAASAVEATAGLALGSSLAWDTFDRADSTSLGSTDSGEAWTQVVASSFQIASNKLTPQGTGSRMAQFEAAADAAIEATVVLQGTFALIMRGDLTFGDQLYAAMTTTALTINKRSGGTPTTLATTAITAVAGQTYRMSFLTSSDRTSAVVKDAAGRIVGSLTHQLSGADQTAYGSKSKGGVFCFNGVGGSFDDLIVRTA